MLPLGNAHGSDGRVGWAPPTGIADIELGRMKNKPVRRLLDEERKRECPNCRSTTDTRIVLTPANLIRVTLNCMVWLLLWLLSEGCEMDVQDYVAVTRKCHKCGLLFAQRRGRSHKLDECVGCGYSLIGNVSGVCPECGWRLMRAHRRSVRKHEAMNRSQS